MEPNQVNPSPDNSGIPQGIPTGVFVPNNQAPVQNTVPTEPTPAPVVTPVVESVVTPTTQAPAAPATEGPLDRVFKGLARFFAKVMGQPDPITGASNANSPTAKKAESIIGKVRGAANQVVAKASDAAGKAVNTVNQATEKIQQVIPQPTTPTPVPPTEAAPVVQQPVQAAPVVEQPVQVTPPTV